MRSSSRAMLSAIGVLAAGGAVGTFVYYDTYLGGLEKAAQKEEEKFLFKFPPVKVVAGELEAGGQKIRFVRLRTGWAIVSPIEAPADQAAIDQFVSAVANVKTLSTIEAPEKDRTPYGLADPRVKITLEVAEEPKAVLLVGGENPFDQRLYVENPALGSIGLTDKSFLSSVNKDLFALRDKRIWSFDHRNVRLFEVEKNGYPLYRIARTEKGFDIIAPEKRAADVVEVTQTLEKLRELRARGFPDDSGTGDPAFLAKFGLERPIYRVRLELISEKELVLRMGTAVNEIGRPIWYGKVEGTRPIFEVFETFFKDIDRPIGELSNRQLLQIDTADVAKLRIRGEMGTIELARDAAWELIAPKKATAADFKVSALIYAAATLRAKTIDTNAPGPKDIARAGLEPPHAAISLSAKNGKELATLLLGKPVPANPADRFAMVKGGTQIAIVESDKLVLPDSADALLAATSTDAR